MILKFKKQSEEDLSKLLPRVPHPEYRLLENSEIIISENQFKTAIKSGVFNYAGLAIPASLIYEKTESEEFTADENYVKLLDHVSASFINCNNIVDSLYPAILLNKNVLLFGTGGHAKLRLFSVSL